MLDGKLVNFCHHAMSGSWLLTLKAAVSAIFIWGRAAGEWESFGNSVLDEGVINRAYSHAKNDNLPIAIPGYEGRDKGQGDYGYSANRWIQALTVNFGFPRSRILPTAGDGFNTKTEFDDYLDLATKNGYPITIAITQQTHALRAMLGVVKSLQDINLERKFIVIPSWPDIFDLMTEVYGSQGQGPFPRIDWIDQEYDRIERYQAKGDLASLEDLASYLRWMNETRPNT